MNDPLVELVERVTKATGPDRILDRDLCLALNYIAYSPSPLNLRPSEDDDAEWLDYEIVEDGKLVDCSDRAPELTGSTDASLALSEAKLPGWAWFVQKIEGVPSRAPQKDCVADLWLPAVKTQGLRVERATADAATPPLAIILALLRALSSQEAAK